MAPNGVRVLLIENDGGETELIRQILSEEKARFKLEHVDQLKKAFECLDGIDVILLDLNLTDSKGLETFTKLRIKAPKIPIIVLSSANDDKFALEAVQQGAQDYLDKDQLRVKKTLTRVLRYAIERKGAENKLREANIELSRREEKLKKALSDLEKTQEALKAAQLQAIHAKKLELAGRLAAGVAHEIKNPLARIRMGIDYLWKEIHAQDKNTPFMLRAMEDAVTKASEVVKTLLDFSSIQSLNIQTGDLHPVIDRALSSVKEGLERFHIELNKDFCQDMPPIKLDAHRIEEVLINLLTNAVHVMPSGGKLTVRTLTKKLETDSRRVGYRKGDIFVPGETVAILQVEDTGPGISEEMLDKVFDPFFTTKKHEGGTGLGLAVAKNIMELHGGLVEIGNKEGGGARVTLTFKT